MLIHIYVYDISMRKSENIRELECLASSQWGMFTSAQARSLGVRGTQVSRMAEAGTVEAMRRGVYRYTVGEETTYSYVKAAWLAAYPAFTVAERLRSRPLDAVVAGRTAAALHGIGDLQEDPYTFIVHTRRQTSVLDLEFHTWPLEESDVTFVEGLPVTTMERTIADLVKGRQDPGHVRQIVTDAFAKGIDLARLETLLDGLGPAGRIVAESARALARDNSVENIELAVVEAMRLLGETMLEVTRVMASQRDEVGLRKTAEMLVRLEGMVADEGRPMVASALRDLAHSMRAVLEEACVSSPSQRDMGKDDD